MSNYSRRNNGSGKSGIYLSRIVNKRSPLEACEHNSKNYSTANLCFSKDGKRLYFESDMDGVYEGGNNNGVVFITNQYGEYLPFMSVPIGEISYTRSFEIYDD